VPAALAAAAGRDRPHRPGLGGADLTPALVWTAPRSDPATLVGVGLPLFLVTMVSPNVPGMAVLATYGYRPRLGPILGATGLGTLSAAPFGGHAVNLAAISAAGVSFLGIGAAFWGLLAGGAMALLHRRRAAREEPVAAEPR
jgi:benzoate membrane transport protein